MSAPNSSAGGVLTQRLQQWLPWAGPVFILLQLASLAAIHWRQSVDRPYQAAVAEADALAEAIWLMDHAPPAEAHRGIQFTLSLNMDMICRPVSGRDASKTFPETRAYFVGISRSIAKYPEYASMTCAHIAEGATP